MTDRQPANLPPATPCERLRAEINKYSDWDKNIMQAIAQAENRSCDPLRHNETASETHRRADGSVICVGSYGALQVGCLHYNSDENRNNLVTNIKVAYRVWQSSGYSAWTMYNNGQYKNYLR